jgi:hypothetical protein
MFGRMAEDMEALATRCTRCRTERAGDPRLSGRRCDRGLRGRKRASADAEAPNALRDDITRVYTADAANRVEYFARRVAAATGIPTLHMERPLFDTIGARRRIAAAVIEAGGYKL